MTGKERILTALQVEKPDRVPLYIHGINEAPIIGIGRYLTDGLPETTQFHEMNDGEKMKLVDTLFLIHEEFGVDGFTSFEIGHETELDHKHVQDDWGIVYTRSPHGLPVAKGHPVKVPLDLIDYRPPEPKREHLLLLDLARERFSGRKALFWLMRGAFVRSWRLAGLLVSAVYWSILIFSLPVSVFIDRWSRKKCIGLMALFWSLATLTCALTRNFAQLFGVRTAIGIGEAGYAPGGTAMIATLFPKQNRAKMLGFWNASIPLGSALGIVLGGFIAEHFGWRHAFGIVAIPGMLIAVLFFFVKDYETVPLVPTPADGTDERKDKMNPADIARHFARNKTLMFNNLAFAANTFVTTSLLTWLPTYYHRLENLPMDKAATKGGAVMLLAIVGAPLGGFLADKWLRQKDNARLLFPAFSSLITSVALLLAFSVFQGVHQYLVLLFAGITAVAFVPAAVAVTQDVVHPGLRAISLSLCVIVQHILGSALGPPFVGALSDNYGLAKAMAVLPVFAFLAACLFMVASLFYAFDKRQVEGLGITVA